MRNEYFNGYNEQDSLYLCYCGYENCRAGHGMPPHIRDCYLIHYLVGGTCMVHMDGKSYEASAGDYFVIPPNRLASYHDNGQPMSYYWYGFGGDEAEAFYRDVLKEQVVLHAANKEEPVQLIKDCLEQKDKPFANQFRLRGNLYLLLSLFDGSVPGGDTAQEHKYDLVVEQALSYIHHNYMKNLTVHEIAEYLGMERTSFSKMFKRKVGLTAIEYIGNCQIDKALELIRNTNMSFIEISNLCGICDPYYFTKLIKNRTGMTPTQYKKTYNKQRSEEQK